VATFWRELLPWAALGLIVALLLVWLVPAAAAGRARDPRLSSVSLRSKILVDCGITGVLSESLNISEWQRHVIGIHHSSHPVQR
jgi:hypothetical protein